MNPRLRWWLAYFGDLSSGDKVQFGEWVLTVHGVCGAANGGGAVFKSGETLLARSSLWDQARVVERSTGSTQRCYTWQNK
jgi:hypothetical protein